MDVTNCTYCCHDEVSGTLNYMSPERYTSSSPYHPWHEWSGDVWSIGVVAFELLFQQRLFEWNQDVTILKKQIIEGLWSFPSVPSNMRMSDMEWLAAKHFIHHLLAIDPNKRACAAHALKHPWLCDNYDKQTLTPTELQPRMDLWEKNVTTYAPFSEH